MPGVLKDIYCWRVKVSIFFLNAMKTFLRYVSDPHERETAITISSMVSVLCSLFSVFYTPKLPIDSYKILYTGSFGLQVALTVIGFSISFLNFYPAYGH